MKRNNLTKQDWLGAGFFFLLTFIFVLLMILNADFFDWAWGRHHNILSWYIRPLAVLPYFYFAYKRSLTGMMASVFVLATSMAWFPEPASVSPEVLNFLAMEQEYLSSTWTLVKTLFTLAVPLYFVLIAFAFWKRNLIYGGIVIIASAVLKVIWSILEGGESGLAVIPTAAIGLVLTLALLYFGNKFQERREKKKIAES